MYLATDNRQLSVVFTHGGDGRSFFSRVVILFVIVVQVNKLLRGVVLEQLLDARGGGGGQKRADVLRSLQ